MNNAKLVAGCLAVYLMGSAVPFLGVKDVPAITANASEISGTIKDTNISWTFTDDGVLTYSVPEGATGELPDGVTTVDGFGASYGDLDLKKADVKVIIIKEGITKIGENAFYGVANATSVSLPSTLKEIGKGAFYGCAQLQGVVIPENVTTIGIHAFFGCSSLEKIVIPASVTFIGSSAFGKCSSLTDVTILNRNVEIATNAFPNDDKLTIHGYTGSTAEEYQNNPSSYKIHFDTNVQIPDTTEPTTEAEIVKSGTLKNNPDISWTLDSNGVLTVSGTGEVTSGFGSNTLTSAKTLIVKEGITKIGDNAFSGMNNVTTVTLPNTLTSIGKGAFASNFALQEINIPDGVTEIGDAAFRGCNSLTKVSIPSSVNSIGEYAFCQCTALETVTIPFGVTSIGAYAFRACDALKTITIPASVDSVGAQAFYQCPNLAEAIVLNPECALGNWAFSPSVSGQKTKIYGYANSTAQAYAEENKKDFEYALLGDADGDGVMTSEDVKLLQKGLHSSKGAPKNCDMNGDGVVNVYDLVLLKRYMIKQR